MFAKNKLNRLLIFIFLLSSIFTICYLSCDINSPVKDVKVIINSKPINTIISGLIINSATNEPLTGRQVTLTIEGQNKSDIVDLTAEPQSEFITYQGIVSFAITNDFVPSETSPAKVVLVARAEGFLPTSMPLNIYEVGDAQFNIHMIEINNPPNGAATARGTGTTNATGALINNDLEVIASELSTSAFASIKVPVGTIIKDEAGNPLTGTITATIVYCTNQTEESLLSFPGGFSVTTNTNGVIDQTAFLTAGFASIEIKDGAGRIAALFSPPINITIQTNANTVNPETNDKIKAGDSVPVWSYDLESCVWNFEKDVIFIGPDSHENYLVSFSTDHLTLWNLDWWLEPLCEYTRKINIVGKPVGYPIRLVLTLLESPGYIWDCYSNYGQYETDNWVQWHWVGGGPPAGRPCLLEAYDGYNNSVLVGSLIIDDLCGSGDLTLEVNLIYIPPNTEVILHCEGWCTCDPDIIIRPNGNPIWYRLTDQENTFWLYAGETKNGKITIPGILIDRTYHYGTWYEDEYDPDGQVETGWYEIEAKIFTNLKAEIRAVSHNVDSVYTYYAKEYNRPVLYFREQLPPNICAELCSEAEEP